MKAHVGDRLVVESTQSNKRWIGVILEVRHPDGSPPYLVRWLDTEHVGLVYPGPYAHIEPGTPRRVQRAAAERTSR